MGDMTSKSNICHFTGLKIDPGRGILFARNDGQLFHFLNSKARQLYNNKKRPSKIGWTMAYRKLHKKGRACERLKRKKTANFKSTLRSYVSASIQAIKYKRSEKTQIVSLDENL